MNEQLLKTPGADVLSSRKKLNPAPPPPPPPHLVRPRVKLSTACGTLNESVAIR